jgi:CheY-like chemotaxis protein
MKPRTMIVKDEKTAVQVLSLLLADEGYEIIGPETGEAGVAVDLPLTQPQLVSES